MSIQSFKRICLASRRLWQRLIMSALTNEDYEPKNILITGGAGFIASHVVILLATKYPQFKIVNFDRLDCKCCAL